MGKGVQHCTSYLPVDGEDGQHCTSYLPVDGEGGQHCTSYLPVDGEDGQHQRLLHCRHIKAKHVLPDTKTFTNFQLFAFSTNVLSTFLHQIQPLN